MSKSENVSRGRHLVPTGYLYGERIPLGCEIQIHNVVSVKYITCVQYWKSAVKSLASAFAFHHVMNPIVCLSRFSSSDSDVAIFVKKINDR